MSFIFIKRKLFRHSRIVLVLFTRAVLGADEIDPGLAAAPLWELERDSHVQWRAEFSQVGAITAAGGRIFAGATFYSREASPDQPDTDRALLACLDEDGTIQWESFHRRIGKRVFDMGQPIRSKPCVDGDRVYYISNRGELMCLGAEGLPGKGGVEIPINEKTGPRPKILWKLDMAAELGVYHREAADVGNPIASPIVIGDLLFCVTGHGRPIPDDTPEPTRPRDRRASTRPPSFLAVDKLTGKIVWSSNAPGENILYGQWSSPVRARVNDLDEVIFPGGDGLLYGFEPASGKLLWKLDCNAPGAKDRFADGFDWLKDTDAAKHPFFAAPVVHGTMVFAGLNEDFEEPVPSPLLGIDLAAQGGTPAIKWKFNSPAFHCTYTSAAVANGIVFTVGFQNELFALDEATGIELWHASLGPDERNMFGNPIIHGGLVYAGGESSLSVLVAGPKKKIVGRFESESSVAMGTPEFVGNRMYLPDYNSVWAVQLPAAILRAEE